jgi:hypothetical protein
VKELYEKELTQQSIQAAELMKQKISVQCEYEEKIHSLTEEYKKRLMERRDSAGKQLKKQGRSNAEAKKEFTRVLKLQEEETLILHSEHESEMKMFRAILEEEVLNIEKVRYEYIG